MLFDDVKEQQNYQKDMKITNERMVQAKKLSNYEEKNNMEKVKTEI